MDEESVGRARLQVKCREDLWVTLDQHRSRLIVLSRQYGLTQHDAEDVASEALLRAAANHDTLDRERLAQFLTTVTRRICVDEIRRAHRQHLLPYRYGPQLDAPSPEDQVSLRSTLADALSRARLTATEASVVVMTAAGYRHLEIAKRLNLTSHASELALSRARHKARGTHDGHSWT